MIVKGPERKTFKTLYALDSFGTYWLENERLIQNAAQAEEEKSGPKWAPQTDEEYSEFHMERQIARRLHDEIVTPNFRYSCIVTLYAIVERELRRLVENLGKEPGAQPLEHKRLNGSLLDKVSKYCEVFFKLRFPNCPEFGGLRDLQKVRDCIVHCKGEVDASRDRDYLICLKDQRLGFFAFGRASIKIEAQCVEQFIGEMWRFFSWVFDALKWKIDDSWQEKKWFQNPR